MKQLAITSSLMKYWQENYAGNVTTVYPGMQVDSSELAAWAEWQSDFWNRYLQRAAQKELVQLSVQVHLFSRGTASGLGIHELVDSARSTFTQVTVPVYDYAESGGPLVGYVGLHEPEIRDMSRDDLDGGRHRLRHSLIEWRGIAQEV